MDAKVKYTIEFLYTDNNQLYGYFCPTHRKGKIGRFHYSVLSSSPSVMERRQKSSFW